MPPLPGWVCSKILPWTTVPKHYPFHLHSTTSSSSKKRSRITTFDVLLQGGAGDGYLENNNGVIIDTPLPKDESIWKTEGERIIRNTAMGIGGDAGNLLKKKEDIDIQWKSGKIIVTIKDAVLKGNSLDDDEIDNDGDMGLDGNNFILDDLDDDDGDDDTTDNKADVVSIARAINYALGEEGEGSMAYNIVVHHEIEVTTPGATDELQGIMFESYKGFNVIVETFDPKKKDGKVKIVEGNLVERTDDFTILNCKGQRRKLKNQNVLSVKLPKAKREKSVK
eukprot:CAMPEP_0203634944 /NCGR_PEP_ID=MMETSP0088-20131115/1792_1 /ASSEMBLY_ACC=CAM_ASM_001087 /TAXON_ID=426623 /ORGANISM="Chaetoceros affinis, Strain CCMP159" /LENGTH=279 /DNA_ID=CAMNT_0050488657 /DNA_START=231 /DNA_END=1070 /DNA_ORIENTATION=+